MPSPSLRRRAILHIDMDAFFAAVEQHDNPDYRGKPIIVGSPPGKRGVVSTCSYEARAFGVHSAMPSAEAYRRCPNGIFVLPRMARYQTVSDNIFAIFERFTPWIEPLSIDEAFLDISGAITLFGPPESIAMQIRQTIHDELGITASAGIAHNKFLAKLASEENKPNGQFSVPQDHTACLAWLASKPVKALWGVGPVTAKTLAKYGLYHVSDLQQIPVDKLHHILTPLQADHLINMAFGHDTRPLVMDSPDKSLSREHTFDIDTHDTEAMRRHLMAIADDVGFRLRRANLYTRTIRIKIRWDDFTTISKQKTLPIAIQDDFSLREEALALLASITLIKAVRLIGFGATSLTDLQDPPEDDLFGNDTDEETIRRTKRERLCRTIDTLAPGSVQIGSIPSPASSKSTIE